MRSTPATSAFAEGGPAAQRYRADVSPFAASDDDSAESLAALAGLIPSEGTVILIQADPCTCCCQARR